MIKEIIVVIVAIAMAAVIVITSGCESDCVKDEAVVTDAVALPGDVTPTLAGDATPTEN